MECVASRKNEVSQVERFLFSKLHFWVRDDKHVIVQGSAQFEKISGFLWSGYFDGVAKIQTMARPNSPRTAQKPSTCMNVND